MSHPNFRTGLPCNCGFGKFMDGHRFAAFHAQPWEPGMSGKGIYFPYNDHIVTWSDDRHHGDVWDDDEYAQIPGETHHFNIAPDGTVKDEGAFTRNYDEQADTSVPELAAALQRYHPSLRLDKSQWKFKFNAPTEPLPEPESEDDERHHGEGVQTGNDFAGSL